MECERFEEMLDRLFDETKSLTATDEMKEHMAECASCRNLYRLKEALLPIGECEADAASPLNYDSENKGYGHAHEYGYDDAQSLVGIEQMSQGQQLSVGSSCSLYDFYD